MGRHVLHPLWPITCIAVLACGTAGSPEQDSTVDPVEDGIEDDTGPDLPPPPCGDGVLDPGEECDDGDYEEWDGCTWCRVSEFRVSEYVWDEQNSPAIAVSSGGRFAIAWQSRHQDRDGWGVFLRLMDAETGTPAGHEIQINSRWRNDEIQPSIAVDASGGVVAAWSSNGQDGDEYGVFAQRFDASGARAGPELQVNEYTAGCQWNPHVSAAPDGRFVVVWGSEEQDGSEDGVYGRAYDAAGSPLGPEIQVNEFTSGNQTSPTAATADDGRSFVVWQSMGQDGSGWGVYARVLDAGGVPEGPEIPVNGVTVGNQYGTVDGALADGGFAVLWCTRDGMGGLRDTTLQRFDHAGVPSGEPLALEPYLDADRDWTTIAVARDGGFLMAWGMELPSGEARWIHMQRFDATGLPVGPVLVANTRPEDRPGHVCMAIGPDGRFLVAWQDVDFSSTGIYAQRFDASGGPRGLLPW
jgi:cysteine-rich repeat protein